MNEVLKAAQAEDTTPPEDKLTQISAAIAEMQALQAEIALDKAALSAKNATLKTMGWDTIPSLMDEVGVASVTLPDGTKATIQPYYSGEAKTPDQLAWMEANGHGDIIKDTITLTSKGVDQQKRAEIIDRAKELGMKAVEEFGVHHQTMKGWIGEMVEEGEDIDMKLLNIVIARQVRVK